MTISHKMLIMKGLRWIQRKARRDPKDRKDGIQNLSLRSLGSLRLIAFQIALLITSGLHKNCKYSPPTC